MKALRTLSLGAALYFVAIFFWMMLKRIAFPYDLEWMEGGELTHALRILDGKPLYAPPSVDFIPYLYTPFYPILVAGFSKVFGMGYGLGRMLSLLSFLAATVLGYVFARREGGSRATAACAMALPIAAYVPTGQWHELARPDSLYLGLVVAAILVAWWKRRTHLGAAAAALLLVAAFFTKQTASPFMIALGVALLAIDWRTALTYGATLAATGLPLLFWANRATDGWFWTYVFKLHQSHDFFRARAWLGTPTFLILILGPSLLLIPWGVARRRTPGILYAAYFALVGIVVACVGFGTQWAHINAFVPGVFFSAIAIGAAGGRLVSVEKNGENPRLRPAAVYLILAISIFMAPGALIPGFAKITPRDWALHLHTKTGYDPRPYVPTVEDRKNGDALLARLRAAPGEVLIPFHPFYGYLAGRKSYLHRMGVMDIQHARLGPPRGLAESIAQQRWALAVFDDKIDGNWHLWPGMLQHYRIAEQIRGPRCVAGAMTEPRYLLVPATPPPPVIDREP